MTEEEKAKIEAALAATNPTETIPATCREIVLKRIDRAQNPARDLQFMIMDIIKASDFGCVVKLDYTKHPGKSVVEKPGVKGALIWGMLGVAALFAALNSEKDAMRGFFGIMSVASSFMAGRSLSVREIQTLPSTEARMVAVTTADKIAQQLDRFTESLNALFDYKQLETTHKYFLSWLQRQYADSSDEKFKNKIESLLDKFGYSLEAFSDEKIEAFEVSEANIEAPITTVPALFAQDGHMILAGNYIIPLKN